MMDRVLQTKLTPMPARFATRVTSPYLIGWIVSGWSKPATLRWVLRWVRREPQTRAMNQLNVSLQHSIVTLSA